MQYQESPSVLHKYRLSADLQADRPVSDEQHSTNNCRRILYLIPDRDTLRDMDEGYQSLFVSVIYYLPFLFLLIEKA